MKKVFSSITKLPLKAIDHLTDDKRPIHHRMVAGVCFMATGVCISLAVGEIAYLKPFADGFGYLLHGAGCTPFIEHFSNVAAKVTIED